MRTAKTAAQLTPAAACRHRIAAVLYQLEAENGGDPHNLSFIIPISALCTLLAEKSAALPDKTRAALLRIAPEIPPAAAARCRTAIENAAGSIKCTLDEAQSGQNCLTPQDIAEIYEILLESDAPKSNQRAKTGSYYTPRAVVTLMARAALRQTLSDSLPDRTRDIERIFGQDAPQLDPAARESIFEALRKITVLDPACGAGAFLTGVFDEMMRIAAVTSPSRSALTQFMRTLPAALFGIDIQPAAVIIARFRMICRLITCGRSPGGITFPITAADALDEASFQKIPHTFSVVIGNPPYGIALTPAHRARLKTISPLLTHRFDIYLAFFELAFLRAEQTVCFITPDKWLSNHYAERFRRARLPGLCRITHLGRGIFSAAGIDAVITLFGTAPVSRFTIEESDTTAVIEKSALSAPWSLDISAAVPPIVAAFESAPHRIADFAAVEYAFAAPQDAYKLPPIIDDIPGARRFRILNTGTIGKFNARWGIKPMKYLGRRYTYPHIAPQKLARIYPAHAVKNAAPKIIIKGLNLLDATLDLRGTYLSTVATVILHGTSPARLKILAAILNADAAFRYLAAKYRAGTYNGALRFTPRMIAGIPVPDIPPESRRDIIRLVDDILRSRTPLDKSDPRRSELNRLINRIYHL